MEETGNFVKKFEAGAGDRKMKLIIFFNLKFL